jgi:serine protease Do
MGERVFTLGYPRNDIVYGEGYLSARTGFNSDSLSYQVQSVPTRAIPADRYSITMEK